MKPTFAQIEMAKMRAKRRKQRQREIMQQAELSSLQRRVQSAEERAMALAACRTVQETLSGMSHELTKEVSRIVSAQLSKVVVGVTDQAGQHGPLKIIRLRIPEFQIHQAIPVADIERRTA